MDATEVYEWLHAGLGCMIERTRADTKHHTIGRLVQLVFIGSILETSLSFNFRYRQLISFADLHFSGLVTERPES
jgi:hypothetical protein